MGQIGLFYGSSTGKTEAVAYQMKDLFDKAKPGLVDIANIGSTSPEQFLGYQYLICGIPTWNTGQLQDDWAIFVPKLKGKDMKGKKVAIFGLGDQNGYGFNFLDAVGTLADDLMDCGAQLWGMWSTREYQFNESKAQVEDLFLGLGVDEEGQSEKTSARLQAWVAQIVKEFEV
ncbi:MAG: flavodoxin [Anaerolineae bacterium]|nr:flavodoxin [Anaerolineae bacterium]NUQ05343.1 flavodoxin [Anaerolineae bacterium]